MRSKEIIKSPTDTTNWIHTLSRTPPPISQLVN